MHDRHFPGFFLPIGELQVKLSSYRTYAKVFPPIKHSTSISEQLTNKTPAQLTPASPPSFPTHDAGSPDEDSALRLTPPHPHLEIA